MLTAKVLQNGDSQEIQLPKEVHTEQREFFIRKLGDGFILIPMDDPWYPLRNSIGMIPDDFMEDREQPSWSI